MHEEVSNSFIVIIVFNFGREASRNRSRDRPIISRPMQPVGLDGRS
jgi:hypothetical protein